jgi:hypothetical protein
VSASACFHRATGHRSARRVEDERLPELIEHVAERNYGAYGYRKTWLTLGHQGVDVGRDRIKQLMRATGLQGAKPWRTTIPDPAALRPPDRALPSPPPTPHRQRAEPCRLLDVGQVDFLDLKRIVAR